MLKVTVELIPAGGGPREVLGVGYIVNDGTGTSDAGNYYGWLLKKGYVERTDANDLQRVFKFARLSNFPRQQLGPWDLLYRYLRETVGSRNC